MDKGLSLVSIIIPTLNSSKTLEACLLSIKKQTYKNIEIIVVDNYSKDETRSIAKKFTQNVFQKGPERSAQRNYGVQTSKGKYVFIIDSDMALATNVVEDCVNKIQIKPGNAGIIVPEESFGQGFWAQCKKLERSFYVGIDWMEAARFFRKDVFNKVGGYDENLISGEDWDLSQRVDKHGKIERIQAFILHNEGKISLLKTIKKKLYYAGKFTQYIKKNGHDTRSKKQTDIMQRYWLYFSHPIKLFKRPILGLGMLFMKTCEFGFGGVGYIKAK